jgi:hypothetical protein
MRACDGYEYAYWISISGWVLWDCSDHEWWRYDCRHDASGEARWCHGDMGNWP